MWHQLTEAVLTIVKTDFLQQSGLMEVRVHVCHGLYIKHVNVP